MSRRKLIIPLAVIVDAVDWMSAAEVLEEVQARLGVQVEQPLPGLSLWSGPKTLVSAAGARVVNVVVAAKFAAEADESAEALDEASRRG